MKKILMTVVAVLAAMPAVCQPALTKGMENKRLAPDELSKARYVGTVEQGEVWMMEGRKHVKQVVITDLDLNPVLTLPLPGTASEQVEVLTAGCDVDCVGVLTAQHSNKRTVVMSYRVAGGAVTSDTVNVLDYGRKDECLVWGASSPSGTYHALVAVVKLNDTKQFYTYTALFDGEMNRLWQRSPDMGSLYELVVTDAGRIVTFGHEREGVESHFVYNVFDNTSAVTYDAAVKCDPVEEMHLAAVVGSHAVAVGTYHPSDGRNADKLTAGVLTLSFNLDSAAIDGVTMRPFQNEDMNIFLNEKTKKIQKGQECDHLTVMGVAATPWGAAMALGRNMVVEKSSGGSVSREGIGVGVSVVSVDTTGSVNWVRNIRRNDVNDEGVVPTVGFAACGDRVCLVKTEHAKMPLGYEISESAKHFTQGDGGNVFIYTIDDNGMTEKLMLERKSKLTVTRAMGRGDQSLLMVGAVGKKSRLSVLKF